MIALESLSSAPSWMRPPTWRWLAATKIAAQCPDELPTKKTLLDLGFPSDPYLLTAVRYFSVCYNKDLGGPKVARVKWPDCYRASMIFKGHGHLRFWKETLEALLLTSLTPDTIAKQLGLAGDAKIINMYHRLYFDVSAYKNSEACVQLNILAMSCRGDGLKPDDDYVGKFIAYSQGFESYYSYYLGKSAGQLGDSHSEWIRQIIAGKLSTKSLEIASATRADYIRDHLEIINAGRNWLDSVGADAEVVSRKTKTESLNRVAEALHTACDNASVSALSLQQQYAGYLDVDWTVSTEKEK